MTDALIREAELNHRLALDQPGRRFEPVGALAAGLIDTLWRRYEARRPGKQERIRAERHVVLLPAFESTHLEQFSGQAIR